VADLFKVKVKAVNTIVVKGKRKAARGKAYTRSDIKKAIVTLEEGHQIDITTGL
jgi:large subunit ribosomal protein L23